MTYRSVVKRQLVAVPDVLQCYDDQSHFAADIPNKTGAQVICQPIAYMQHSHSHSCDGAVGVAAVVHETCVVPFVLRIHDVPLALELHHVPAQGQDVSHAESTQTHCKKEAPNEEDGSTTDPPPSPATLPAFVRFSPRDNLRRPKHMTRTQAGNEGEAVSRGHLQRETETESERRQNPVGTRRVGKIAH